MPLWWHLPLEQLRTPSSQDTLHKALDTLHKEDLTLHQEDLTLHQEDLTLHKATALHLHQVSDFSSCCV